MSNKLMDEYEETALLGCKAVREFLVYSGEKKEYLNRAKVGAVAMGSYARLRATVANERQISLVEERLGIEDKTVRRLSEAV